jgi:DNA mismatch repair ATPase MutL
LGPGPVVTLLSHLARFASSREGAAGTEAEKASEGEERMEEDRQKEGEGANEVEELARKDTGNNNLAGIEVSKPFTPAKNEKSKTGNKQQEPIEVDDDGDVRMEENVAPLTSSTIGVPEYQGTKDVDSGVNQCTPSLTPAADGAISEGNTSHPEIIRSAETSLGNVTVRFDLEQVKDAWVSRLEEPARSAEEVYRLSSKVSADASLTNTEDNESAMRALERVIDKSDFASMNVIGQFNLGFIIVRRRKTAHDHKIEPPLRSGLGTTRAPSAFGRLLNTVV